MVVYSLHFLWSLAESTGGPQKNTPISLLQRQPHIRPPNHLMQYTVHLTRGVVQPDLGISDPSWVDHSESSVGDL